MVLTGACLFLFNVAPLRKGASATTLLLVVGGMYAACRLYFSAAFALLKKLQAIPLASKHPALVSCAFIGAAALAGGALLYAAFPAARAALARSLWDSMGDLPAVLQKSFDGERKRLYERAWKVLGLLVGWALFLFVLELVARAGLWLSLTLFRAVRSGLRDKRGMAKGGEEEEDGVGGAGSSGEEEGEGPPSAK